MDRRHARFRKRTASRKQIKRQNGVGANLVFALGTIQETVGANLVFALGTIQETVGANLVFALSS